MKGLKLMAIAAEQRTDTARQIHSRYDAFADVPDEVSVEDVARLMRYVQGVVLMRHPHVHRLQLVPDVDGLLMRPSPRFWRYAIQLELTAVADRQYPDLVDQVVVDMGCALRVCLPPMRTVTPIVGLLRRNGSPLDDPSCPWCAAPDSNPA